MMKIWRNQMSSKLNSLICNLLILNLRSPHLPPFRETAVEEDIVTTACCPDNNVLVVPLECHHLRVLTSSVSLRLQQGASLMSELN
jgi:hypothetical protein